MTRFSQGGAAFLALGLLFLAVFSASRAEAIPAYSREYKTECTTCHTIYPQLNEFGQAFEKNGFVWPHAVPLSKKVKATRTEEERKSAEYVMLSGIPSVLPLSASLNASYVFNDKVEDEFNMKNYSAEIFASGAFGGDRIGFWFNESLGNQNTTATNSLSGPSQLFFVLRDPLGIPAHLKIGRFSPDLSLWKTTLNGRMFSAGTTVDGYSYTGAQSGLEITSIIANRVQAVVGMTDRNNAVGKDVDAHSVNDFYGRVGVKFGGSDYEGQEPEVDLDKDSVWDFLSVSASAFGYSGSTSKGDGVNRDVTRFGCEAEAVYKKAILMLGATFGDNETATTGSLKSTALSAEIDYLYSAQFAVALRYDSLDVDGKDLRTVITPGVIYAPLQNFKFRLSAAIDSNPSNAAAGKAEKNTTVTLSASTSF
jgi:hypothetical protein